MPATMTCQCVQCKRKEDFTPIPTEQQFCLHCGNVMVAVSVTIGKRDAPHVTRRNVHGPCG